MQECNPKRAAEKPKLFSRFRAIKCDECEHSIKIKERKPRWMTEEPKLFFRVRIIECNECARRDYKDYWYKVYKNDDYTLTDGSLHYWICRRCGRKILEEGSEFYTGFRGKRGKSMPMSLINESIRKKEEEVSKQESEQYSELGLDFY